MIVRAGLRVCVRVCCGRGYSLLFGYNFSLVCACVHLCIRHAKAKKHKFILIDTHINRSELSIYWTKIRRPVAMVVLFLLSFSLGGFVNAQYPLQNNHWYGSITCAHLSACMPQRLGFFILLFNAGTTQRT